MNLFLIFPLDILQQRSRLTKNIFRFLFTSISQHMCLDLSDCVKLQAFIGYEYIKFRKVDEIKTVRSIDRSSRPKVPMGISNLATVVEITVFILGRFSTYFRVQKLHFHLLFQTNYACLVQMLATIFGNVRSSSIKFQFVDSN